jgi:hypothetical protein
VPEHQHRQHETEHHIDHNAGGEGKEWLSACGRDSRSRVVNPMLRKLNVKAQTRNVVIGKTNPGRTKLL